MSPTAIQSRAVVWERQYGALTAAIERATERGDDAFVSRLDDELIDLEDRRCESCGRFEDDPTDLHRNDCPFATMPRPSLNRDSDVPIIDQVCLVLATSLLWRKGAQS
jgi:hypothetical protein